MIKNYFTTAFRNLVKNKIFSLINILGLSIGISSALVIYLLVSYDFNFDKFEKDKERIYRIVSNFTFSGEPNYNSGVTYPMGNAVHREVTGLEIVTPFSTWDENNTKITIPGAGKKKETIFKKQGHIIYADENYFRLLPYEWIAGSPKTSLQQLYQVVLTESNARLYFGNLTTADIIGREIIFNDSVRTTVTGIVKDLEERTDFIFKTFVSRVTQENTSLKPDFWDDWESTTSASQLFVKLSPQSSKSQIEKQVNDLFKKYKKQNPDNSSTTSYALQPLRDVHFNATYGTFGQRIAHKPTLYGLLAVAAFLLLLGCINFINLTTAQASQRAKEIGIRKTMGSSRKQLIFQFLSETFFLTLIAAILSLLIAPLLLKVFADFIPEGLHYQLQPDILAFLLLLVTAVSALAGFYPALVLSSYKPVLVLKNQAFANTGKTRNVWLRKTLTVSQFIIAQVFIIATILVTKQISYSLNKDMGFKKDAIVYFKTNFYDTVARHRFVLMDKLKAIPEIAMISLANDPPSINSVWTSTMKYKDGKKELEASVQVKLGDTNYIKLFQMKLLAGTNLPFSDTTKSLLINEAYAHFLGFKDPQQAIGKNINWDDKAYPITGVVANFHQRSLHEPIKPLIITSLTRQQRAINIALRSQNAESAPWKTTISKIEKAWKEVYPEEDFEFTFLDETIAKYYKAEQDIAKLLIWATGLAIFISCLGLLGLVTYITHQRTKEIGVRKVIGASVVQIISLLSKDFLKLVLVAFIIAIPIAWWGAYKWLQNFEYKTTISVWVFLAGGLLLFLMALLILCIKTFRAASANPVKSLRTE